MEKDKYKLDKVFTEEAFYNNLAASPILKLSNLQEFLTHYQEQVTHHTHSGEYLDTKTDQIYTSEFFFPTNQFYQISWNIQKARELILEHSIPVDKLELHKLSNTIFDEDIEHHHLPNALHNDDPIIVVFYEPTQEFIPIDGNHRAYARLQKNQKYIDAYILPPQIHMLAMCSTLDYALYMFAHNLNALGCYVCGAIDYDRFMDEMYRF